MLETIKKFEKLKPNLEKAQFNSTLVRKYVISGTTYREARKTHSLWVVLGADVPGHTDSKLGCVSKEQDFFTLPSNPIYDCKKPTE